MANINLLPWREELRRENQRQFISILGLTAIFGVVFMFAVYTIYDSRVDSQRNRNDYLAEEIRKLDSKIKEIEALEKERQQLIDRMNLIQDLQKSRPHVVRLFDAIAQSVPEGVNLSSIQRSGKKLIFNGVAESGPRVSNFLRKIASSKWIKEGDIKTLDQDKNSASSRKIFSVEAQSDSASPTEEEKS